jgi:taurine dioxygenase
MIHLVIGFILAFSLLISFVKSEVKLNEINKSNFVAEVTGISLENIDNTTFDLIEQLLIRYKILVIRNQTDFTPSGQRSFSRRFGSLHVHLESSSHHPEFDDVNVVSNIVINGSHIGLFGKHVENYHSDLSWSQVPAKYTILHSVIRPAEGGDTEFVNTHAAYDALPIEMKQRLKGKTAGYCYLKLKEIDEQGNVENLKEKELNQANKCAIHPLITTHPITGLKNIYANPTDTSYIHNMTRSESDQLLSSLFQHTAQSQFSYRHQYQDHDVILWDNRGKMNSFSFSSFIDRFLFFFLPF